MFTDPPPARVGVSESEVQPQGVEARVAKLPMSAALRTHTIDERQSFMKGLVAARDDHILGFTMIGAEAGEVVAAVQMAMLEGLPYTACATPSSLIPPWRKDSALFSRTCRRGSSNSGAPWSGIPLRSSQIGVRKRPLPSPASQFPTAKWPVTQRVPSLPRSQRKNPLAGNESLAR
jgi:hypothetical protein